MGHEHHGDCCGSHNHHHTGERQRQFAAHLGSLCCEGYCNHLEHQVQQWLQLQNAFLSDEGDKGTVSIAKPTQKKKKKKSTGFMRPIYNQAQ